MARVAVYYQTFPPSGLLPIMTNPPLVTHIYVAALHFGKSADGAPYIHLNDAPPEAAPIWPDIRAAVELGAKCSVMVGGAGGGFAALFADYLAHYAQLKNFLEQHPEVTGVDLDVEEPVTLENVQWLLSDLRSDFPRHRLTLAPVVSSLSDDAPGLGGFSYKELWNSPAGSAIDYFNCQVYSGGSAEELVSAYDAVVANGYSPERVVLGVMSGTDPGPAAAALTKKYGARFGGVFTWEFFDAQPDPAAWAREVRAAMQLEAPAPPGDGTSRSLPRADPPAAAENLDWCAAVTNLFHNLLAALHSRV